MRSSKAVSKIVKELDVESAVSVSDLSELATQPLAQIPATVSLETLGLYEAPITMPCGVGDIATIMQLVQFSAASLHICIKTLIILGKARSYDRDISGVRLLIELQKHKLFGWALEVGLLQDPPALNTGAQNVPLVV